MLFYPKSSKFKKYQKGNSFNKLNNNFNFIKWTTCSFKLISENHGRITTKQFEAIRALIKKSIKKFGFVRFNISPQMPITKKPSEIRMGKGKGSVDHWVSNVKAGALICEIFFKTGINKKIFLLLKRVQLRLPINTKIISI